MGTEIFAAGSAAAVSESVSGQKNGCRLSGNP